MKKLARTMAVTALLAAFTAGLALSGCAGAGQPEPEPSPSPAGPIDTVAYDGYSVDLLRTVCQLEGGQGNVMVSPYSLMRAMGLVTNGAEGPTQQQLLGAFGVQSIDELNALMANIELGQGATFVHGADGVWVNGSLGKLSPTFQSKVEQLGGTVDDTPFDGSTYKGINEWVNQGTDGMIPELFGDGEITASTVLVVANALAFNDVWAEEYDPQADVHVEQFTCADGQVKDVSLMLSFEDTFIEGPGVTGFSKAYENGYRFVALLPDEGSSPKQLLEGLDGASFEQLVRGVDRYVEVEAHLPKFEQDYTSDMLVALQKMGVELAFTDGAQLGGILEDPATALKVDLVKQKTHVSVDEKGTQAAAATGAAVGLASVAPDAEEPEYRVVKLDRPFVYAILNSQGVPLFIGVVNDPTV